MKHAQERGRGREGGGEIERKRGGREIRGGKEEEEERRRRKRRQRKKQWQLKSMVNGQGSSKTEKDYVRVLPPSFGFIPGVFRENQNQK